MMPNDPILSTDPFDAICTMLETELKTLVPLLKYAVQAWPDPKWLEDTGVNFPSVFFVLAGESGKSMTSRKNVFKAIPNPDGTQNVYYETMRLTYLIQISLFTSDEQSRLDIGWQIKQHLVNSIQFPINEVDTARFIYKDDRMPNGKDNLYQRDLTFEVSARLFKGEVTNVNKLTTANNSLS